MFFFALFIIYVIIWDLVGSTLLLVPMLLFYASIVIVGFSGRTSNGEIQALGAVVRRTIEAKVFSHCWLDSTAATAAAKATAAKATATSAAKKTSSIQRRGSEAVSTFKPVVVPDVYCESVAENEFSMLLRMRACAVHDALQRAHRLARRLQASRFECPPVFTSLPVSCGLARWLFESLTCGLVRLPRAEGEGDQLLYQGEHIMRQGVADVKCAQNVLTSCEAWRPNGRHELNPALLGVAAVRRLRAQIDRGEALLSEGAISSNGTRTGDDGSRARPPITTPEPAIARTAL